MGLLGGSSSLSGIGAAAINSSINSSRSSSTPLVNVGGTIGSAVDGVRSASNSIIDGTTSAINSGTNSIGSAFKEYAPSIANSETGKWLGSAASGIIGNTANMLGSSLSSAISNNASNAVAQIINGRDPKKVLSSMKTNASNILKGIVPKMKDKVIDEMFKLDPFNLKGLFGALYGAYGVNVDGNSELNKQYATFLASLATNQYISAQFLKSVTTNYLSDFNPKINGFFLVFHVPGPWLLNYDAIMKKIHPKRATDEMRNAGLFLHMAPTLILDCTPPPVSIESENYAGRSKNTPYATKISKGSEIQLQYVDTADSVVYKYHQSWTTYIDKVTKGYWEPSIGSNTKNGQHHFDLDYVGAIWVVGFEPFSVVPTFVGKALGAFPTTLPQKELLGMRGQQQVANYSISYTIADWRYEVNYSQKKNDRNSLDRETGRMIDFKEYAMCLEMLNDAKKWIYFNQ